MLNKKQLVKTYVIKLLETKKIVATRTRIVWSAFPTLEICGAMRNSFECCLGTTVRPGDGWAAFSPIICLNLSSLLSS